MKKKDKVLSFEKRKTIYNTILHNPGLHLRELNRLVDFSFGSLRYHINYLIKKDLIMSDKNKGFCRFYVSKKIGRKDKELLNLLRNEIIRKILVIMISSGEDTVFFKEDIKNYPKDNNWINFKNHLIEKHKTTLEYHLNKLVKINVIEKVKIKRKIGYRIIDESYLWDFFLKYNNEISSRRITILLNYFNKHSIPGVVDPFIDNIYDIFPNPYHV